MPFFTVVTICRNNYDEIEKTMKSVLLQKCTDYQYIVIDGASTDGTLQIIKEKEKEFLQNNLNITVISEPDSGIYNAMNKGIGKAEGQYLIFINCGDMLYSSETLMEQKKIMVDMYPNHDIYYGDFFLKSYSMFWIQKGNPDISCMKHHMPSSHQSMFVKTELAKQYPFDENYRIAGDLDFFIQAMVSGKSFLYTESTVAIVTADGLSMDYPELRMSEVAKVKLKYGFITENEYQNILNDCNKTRRFANMRRKIKKAIPEYVGKQWRVHQGVWQKSISSDFADFA